MIFKCQRHFENYPQGDHDTKNVVNIQDEKSNNYLFGNVHCTMYIVHFIHEVLYMY